MWQLQIIFVTAFAVIVFMPGQNSACNEAVCASVVSKCLLTRSCNCTLSDCSCCKVCYNCLHSLYSECCACVDLCLKPNETGSALGTTSLIGDFEDAIPAYFNTLTAVDNDRWQTVTFAIESQFLSFLPKSENGIKYHTQSAEQDLLIKNDTSENCTVVYLNQCTSSKNCMVTCQRMGAASYRWFHDSCCECVGSYCINYGLNESRCKNCPDTGEEEEDFDENDLMYSMEDEDDFMDNE